MISRDRAAPSLGAGDPCLCGSGKPFSACCARPEAASARLGPPLPPSAGPIGGAAAPPVAIPSVLPARLRQRLDNEERIRRAVAGRAMRQPEPAVASQQAPPPVPSAAERGRAAEKFLKNAAVLRERGELAHSIAPLRQAVAANPENAKAHFLLGLTLIKCAQYTEGIAELRRAAALAPNLAKVHLAIGEACEAVGERAEAEKALRRAIACAPKFVEAHMLLGQLLYGTERHAAALECFRRGAAAGRNTTAGSICQSRLLAEAGDAVAAAQIMRRAVQRDPSNYLASGMLAQMLANAGDLEAAIAECERAVDAVSVPVNAFASLVNFKKLTEADRPLIARIEACLQRAARTPRAQMTLRFALGKACDDLGEYERAIAEFDVANRIRRTLSPFNRAACAREHDALIAEFPPRFFAERRGEGVDDETPVLVTGMPRSGTTLVEQMLSSHRQIAGAGELAFWTERYVALRKTGKTAMDGAAARRAGTDYVGLLRGFSAAAMRVIDKSLSNLHLLGLILHALPRTRIIHCRRHPVDTCLSIYFTHFETLKGHDSDRSDLVFYYRQYLRIAAHWRAILPPEQFIEVDYENVIADPETQGRRLVEFCGLEWDPACLRPEHNRRTVRTASNWQVRQPIYRSSVERWRRYEPWLGALRELLPEGGGPKRPADPDPESGSACPA